MTLTHDERVEAKRLVAAGLDIPFHIVCDHEAKLEDRTSRLVQIRTCVDCGTTWIKRPLRRWRTEP